MIYARNKTSIDNTQEYSILEVAVQRQDKWMHDQVDKWTDGGKNERVNKYMRNE